MVFGLPLHPLVVHAVVVLLPLSALGMLAVMAVRRLRASYGILVVLGAILSAGAAFVAVEAGEKLEALIGVPGDHKTLGQVTLFVSIAFAVVAVLWFVVERPWRRQAESSIAATALGWAASLVGLGAIVVTALAGHSGAQAAWGDVAQSVATPAASASPAPSAPATPAATPEATAPQTPAASGAASTYTLADVAQHASADSCWAAVDGDVYDLTSWIANHPGGKDAITGLCGTDATKAFHRQHATQGEPADALAKLRIGTLA